MMQIVTHTCDGDEDPRDPPLLCFLFAASSSSTPLPTSVICLPAVGAGTESLQTADTAHSLLLHAHAHKHTQT